MANLSKVYLSSFSPEKFEFLKSSFGEKLTFTEDSKEADFIIVDLASPVKPDWALCPPLILTAVDGPEDESALNAITFFFPAFGPVRRKREELEAALAFVHSILASNRLRSDFVMQHMKSKEGRND